MKKGLLLFSCVALMLSCDIEEIADVVCADDIYVE